MRAAQPTQEAQLDVLAIQQGQLAAGVEGAGELAHALIRRGWSTSADSGQPLPGPTRPRILDAVGPVWLQLIESATFASVLVRLAYRPAPDRQDGVAG